MGIGRRTRKRPLLGALLWPLLILALSPPRCRAVDLIDVILNLQGADAVDAALLPYSPLDPLIMDNSDISVVACSVGTFSADDGGVCAPCQTCQSEKYEIHACLPWQDRACDNCTVCTARESEACPCAVLSATCFTGDRVCLKLAPTAVTLVVDFSTGGPLSPEVEQYVRDALATGYVDWLKQEFGEPGVTFNSLTATSPGQYGASFTFADVYDQATVSRIRNSPASLFQQGLAYVFGGRRRALLAHGAGTPPPPRVRLLLSNTPPGPAPGRALLSSRRLLANFSFVATGTQSSCQTNTTCDGPYLVFQFFNSTNGTASCGGLCVGAPCPAGLYGGNGQCDPCAAGGYTATAGNTACTPCPAGQTSPRGANASTLCYTPTTTSTPAPTTTTTTPAPTTTTTTPAPTTTADPNATTAAAPNTTATPPPRFVPAPPLATPGPHASDAVAYIVGGAALVFVVGLAGFVASFTGVFATAGAAASAAAAPAAAANQGANVVRYHLVRTSPEPDTAPSPSQQQHRRHGRRG
jgi:hypothetical protein